MDKGKTLQGLPSNSYKGYALDPIKRVPTMSTPEFLLQNAVFTLKEVSQKSIGTPLSIKVIALDFKKASGFGQHPGFLSFFLNFLYLFSV